MIGKITKGANFSGLADYLTRDGRGDVLALDGLASSTPAEAASEMQVAASTSTRCQQPVLHVSIAYAPGETPTDDEARSDARAVLAGLGLAGHQAVIVRHRDKGHEHVHVMANRVGEDGRAVSDSGSYGRVERVLRRIEADRGLTVTEGRHAPSPVTGARFEGPRISANPRQHQAPESIRQTLLEARSWDELHQGLARDGWRLEISSRNGRAPGAILIGPDGKRIGAGKVDRNATHAKLSARLDKRADNDLDDPKGTNRRKSKPKIGGLLRRQPQGAVDTVTQSLTTATLLLEAGTAALGKQVKPKIGGKMTGKRGRSGSSITRGITPRITP